MDESARKLLISSHMRQAKAIAARMNRRTPAHVDMDELLALAYLGLCQAAASWDSYCADRGYDPSRVEYFTPYASLRMNGSILDELRREDWLSKSQRRLVKKAQEVTEDVTFDSIASVSGLSEEDVRRSFAGASLFRPSSLDESFDRRADPRDPGLRATLEAAVLELPMSQQAVLALRYFAGLDLQSISTQLGVSLALVRAHHRAAVSAVYRSMSDSV